MLICVLFVRTIFVGFIVMFSSSKDDTPADTPYLRSYFL